MTVPAASTNHQVADHAVPSDVVAQLARFKQNAASLDAALNERDHAVTTACRWHLLQAFESICARMNAGGGADLHVIDHVRQELLPFVRLGRVSERAYSKPLGYGGDYVTIDLIYENQPAGAGRIGATVDALFLGLPAARAVRHRRELMAREIQRDISQHQHRTVHAMSIGCGPAREVFDAFQHADARSRLQMTLLDMDANALEHVRLGVVAAGLESSVTLVEANVLDVARGRRRLDVSPQDLVYSIGLVDYLADAQAVPVLNLVHTMLRPGGRVVVGNFHPKNPSRGLMDHLLDWRLIHRSEADMDRLFQRSSFGVPCSRTMFEQEGINLFAECVKT